MGKEIWETNCLTISNRIRWINPGIDGPPHTVTLIQNCEWWFLQVEYCTWFILYC